MNTCKAITNKGIQCKNPALPGSLFCWRHHPRFIITFISVVVVVAFIIGLLAGVLEISDRFRGLAPTKIPSVSIAATPLTQAQPSSITPMPKGREPSANLQSFWIGKDYYHPSGKMGDISDIEIERDVEVDRFTYETLGRGPHEWDWKCRDGKLNFEPARFGGVYYLDPPGNWGEKPGFDLRGIRRVLKWEARSVTGTVIVEFIIGGIDWVWDKREECRKVDPSWPDSMPRTVVGRATLTENWQPFTYDLTKMPEDNFKNLIGGFAWVIEWGTTGVKLDSTATPPRPVQPKTFIIEIRNIRYER